METMPRNFSTSNDGLNFEYQKIAVGDRDIDIDTTGDGVLDTRQINEASNARVFKYRIPGKTNEYIMMFMGATVGGSQRRNIYLAWSDDGREWTAQKEPLILASSIADGSFTNLSAPTLVEKDNRLYVTVHASSSMSNARVSAHLIELNKDLSAFHYHGIAYESSPIGQSPDYGRVGGRSYIHLDDTWYMFYEAGQRGSTRIALARTWSDIQLQEINNIVIENGSPALTVGQGRPFVISYEVVKLNGNAVTDLSSSQIEYTIGNTDIIQMLDGQFFANATGSTPVTISVTIDGKTVQGSIVVEVIDGDPWAFVDDRFQLEYTSYWSISQGTNANNVNTITQNLEDGFISMIKTNDSTQGTTYNFTYRYLTKTFEAQTQPGVTFETRARLDPDILTTGAEFTVRANNRQYKLYLAWDPISLTGHIKDAVSGTIQSYELDTTQYHIYRVIVDPDGLTYSVYVDGTKVFDTDFKTGSGSNLVKLGFDTNTRGSVDIDYFKLKWGVELP
jgi:predicted GH43/DUF377 family glycosyl hydrolase